jgi:cell division protein FtsX
MNPNSTPVQEPDFEGEAMKVPAAMQSVPEPTTSGSLMSGPILILLVAILLALLGGIYYWYTIVMSTPITATPSRPSAAMNNEPESTTAEARAGATDVVSTSDDLDAIGADIESTKLEDIDEGFTAIESELGGALGTEDTSADPIPAVTTPTIEAASTTTTE